MAITKTDSFIQDAERYDFDRQLCWAKGSTWAQVDTDQDAWYYGNWANPVTRSIVSYAEGDLVVLRCDTDEEFCSELNRMAAWHATQDSYLRIDPKDQHESLWLGLGLKHLMASEAFTAVI